MPINDHDTLMQTKVLTEANAKAIKDLAQAVKDLTETVREEDKELRHSVARLIEVQTECKYRWESIEQRLRDKKEVLDLIKNKMATKANKSDIQEIRAFIHKSLWWLFGAMGGIIVYLIKMTVFKG